MLGIKNSDRGRISTVYPAPKERALAVETCSCGDLYVCALAGQCNVPRGFKKLDSLRFYSRVLFTFSGVHNVSAGGAATHMTNQNRLERRRCLPRSLPRSLVNKRVRAGNTWQHFDAKSTEVGRNAMMHDAGGHRNVRIAA